MATSSIPASSSTSALTTATRTSKACDACRVRRRKCNGTLPCSTCIKYGTGNTCSFRAKARPQRSLPVSLDNTVSTSCILAGPSRPAVLSHAVEDMVSTWAVQCGSNLDVRLSTESHLTSHMRGPTPAVPGTPHTRLSAFDTFCEVYLDMYQPTLNRSGLQSVYEGLERFLAGTGASPSAEDRLVMLSAICLGTIAEKRLAKDETTLDDFVLYRIIIDSLDQHTLRYSFLALVVMHIVFFFIVQSGGPEEIRSLLQYMTMQWERLDQSANFQSDELDSLGYQTRYRDISFAVLYDGQALLSFRSDGLVPTHHSMYSKHYTSSAIFAQITNLENRVMLWCSTRPGSTDIQTGMHDLERELHNWRNAFRAEERIGGGDLMFYYGLLRYDWLRLILRFPLFHHTIHASASQTVCSQAAADMIRIYSRIQSVASFRSTWPEVRRISSAGQVLLLCYIEGEMSWPDFEPLSQSVDQLLDRIKSGCLAAERSGRVWRELVRIASPLTDRHNAEVAQTDEAFTFDFSTPPVMI